MKLPFVSLRLSRVLFGHLPSGPFCLLFSPSPPPLSNRTPLFLPNPQELLRTFSARLSPLVLIFLRFSFLMCGGYLGDKKTFAAAAAVTPFPLMTSFFSHFFPFPLFCHYPHPPSNFSTDVAGTTVTPLSNSLSPRPTVLLLFISFAFDQSDFPRGDGLDPSFPPPSTELILILTSPPLLPPVPSAFLGAFWNPLRLLQFLLPQVRNTFPPFDLFSLLMVILRSRGLAFRIFYFFPLSFIVVVASSPAPPVL